MNPGITKNVNNWKTDDNILDWQYHTEKSENSCILQKEELYQWKITNNLSNKTFQKFHIKSVQCC